MNLSNKVVLAIQGVYMARKYSYEFKKYLVTVLENGIMSASELSRRCKIHKGVICNIYNRYKHSGESSLHHSFTRNEYSRAFKLNKVILSLLLCHTELEI